MQRAEGCQENRVCVRLHRMDHRRDPTTTDPDKYSVVFENARVRVLAYVDRPGGRTNPHAHPDSVMITLSSFRRRLIHGDTQREVALEAGGAHWLPAQDHAGENIGDTETRTIFVELKGPGEPQSRGAEIGPS